MIPKRVSILPSKSSQTNQRNTQAETLSQLQPQQQSNMFSHLTINSRHQEAQLAEQKNNSDSQIEESSKYFSPIKAPEKIQERELSQDLVGHLNQEMEKHLPQQKGQKPGKEPAEYVQKLQKILEKYFPERQIILKFFIQENENKPHNLLIFGVIENKILKMNLNDLRSQFIKCEREPQEIQKLVANTELNKIINSINLKDPNEVEVFVKIASNLDKSDNKQQQIIIDIIREHFIDSQDPLIKLKLAGLTAEIRDDVDEVNKLKMEVLENLFSHTKYDADIFIQMVRSLGNLTDRQQVRIAVMIADTIETSPDQLSKFKLSEFTKTIKFSEKNLNIIASTLRIDMEKEFISTTNGDISSIIQKKREVLDAFSNSIPADIIEKLHIILNEAETALVKAANSDESAPQISHSEPITEVSSQMMIQESTNLPIEESTAIPNKETSVPVNPAKKKKKKLKQPSNVHQNAQELINELEHLNKVDAQSLGQMIAKDYKEWSVYEKLKVAEHHEKSNYKHLGIYAVAAEMEKEDHVVFMRAAGVNDLSKFLDYTSNRFSVETILFMVKKIFTNKDIDAIHKRLISHAFLNNYSAKYVAQLVNKTNTRDFFELFKPTKGKKIDLDYICELAIELNLKESLDSFFTFIKTVGVSEANNTAVVVRNIAKKQNIQPSQMLQAMMDSVVLAQENLKFMFCLAINEGMPKNIAVQLKSKSKTEEIFNAVKYSILEGRENEITDFAHLKKIIMNVGFNREQIIDLAASIFLNDDQEAQNFVDFMNVN